MRGPDQSVGKVCPVSPGDELISSSHAAVSGASEGSCVVIQRLCCDPDAVL